MQPIDDWNALFFCFFKLLAHEARAYFCSFVSLLKDVNPMPVHDFIEYLKKKLAISQRIVVTSHSNPDGDAIGSSLALAHFLSDLGHDVNVLMPNHFPGFLQWLPGADRIIIFDQNAKLARNVLDESDILFCLDYNELSRSGSLTEDLRKFKGARLMIDHHRDPEIEAFEHYVSDISVSSTAELLYQMLSEFSGNKLFTQSISTCLFVGIMTDTGSFSHSINRPETFEIVASLIRSGIDAVSVHQKIFDTFSESRLRLLGHCISNRMTVLDAYSTAIITLSKSDLADFHFQIGDTEGVVNYPLSMEKIRMSVLITEKKDLIRLSFRSKGDFSVHELARKHFNGGGHKNAAGGNMNDSLENTFQHLLKILPEYADQLNNFDSLTL